LIECRILSAGGGSSPSSNQEPTTASSSSHPLTNRTSPAFLRVMDNGTLIIRSARKSLQGRYTCRAVNRIGQDLTATISISVHGTSISLSFRVEGGSCREMFHIWAGKFEISNVGRRKIKRLNSPFESISPVPSRRVSLSSGRPARP
jgi:hypothetical protein